MAGIYIHIPFCKKACHYCDFYFSTQTSYQDKLVERICDELRIRRDYLPKGSTVQTVYFGGGTPSLLSLSQLQKILNTIYKHYSTELQESTLEANPDDLTPDKLKGYKDLGIDRLSIGIQSFREEILTFYNRAHTAAESLQAIDQARKAGFEKLSIDLIYGFPGSDHRWWKEDLQVALDRDPGHISSYALTIEPRTVLGNWQKKGRFSAASEDYVAEQFELLQEYMEEHGYVQYEISNFAKVGKFAIHNTNYWKGVPYLGVGPSAHSFDGAHRGHNVANNARYLKSLEKGEPPFETDMLTDEERANEYILTTLRTIWGVNVEHLRKEFGVELLSLRSKEVLFLEQSGWLKAEEGRLTLTKQGKLLADSIAEKLFI